MTSDEVNWITDTSSGEVSTQGAAIATGQWYHAVGTYDGANMYLYINGIVVASAAQTGTIDNSAETLRIGSRSGTEVPSGFFDGRIGGVSISATAMTAAEVAWEYQRGRRRIQSTVDVNDALSNVDVKSVQVDQASGHIIICTADNNITILDQFGVPILQDAVPSATLRDAGLWMASGQDIPNYAIGGSSDVEFVQQSRRILG